MLFSPPFALTSCYCIFFPIHAVVLIKFLMLLCIVLTTSRLSRLYEQLRNEYTFLPKFASLQVA